MELVEQIENIVVPCAIKHEGQVQLGRVITFHGTRSELKDILQCLQDGGFITKVVPTVIRTKHVEIDLNEKVMA